MFVQQQDTILNENLLIYKFFTIIFSNLRKINEYYFISEIIQCSLHVFKININLI
jgi:hypothetical protein